MRLLRLCITVFALALALPASAAVTSIPARPVRVLCDALATSNVASKSGAQTIDSVALVAGKIACLTAQSDNKNGAYLVQSSTWKAVDPGLGTGVELYALAGGSNANKLYGADTTGAIVWGTTSVTFTLKSSSGGAFSPSSPGAIGGGTPAAGTFTVLTGNTSASAPVHIITSRSGAPTPTVSATQLWRSNVLPGDNVIFQGGTGDTFILRTPSGTGTSDVRKSYYVETIADDGTVDITVAGGGHGTITAAGASGSTSCMFSFADNGATTDNGLTGTNCAVADTDTKLCALQGMSGHLVIKNRLGSSQKVVIELTEGVAP